MQHNKRTTTQQKKREARRINPARKGAQGARKAGNMRTIYFSWKDQALPIIESATKSAKIRLDLPRLRINATVRIKPEDLFTGSQLLDLCQELEKVTRAIRANAQYLV